MVFWDFPFDRAVAIENGRLTLFRLVGSGRVPLVIFDLRANGLQMDLRDWGERPAGLRLGADFGVDGWGVDEMRGAGLVSIVFNANREVLRGLEGAVEMEVFLLDRSSSSSDPRLRLEERLRVGSMFSVSMSPRGFLLPVMMMAPTRVRLIVFVDARLNWDSPFC